MILKDNFQYFNYHLEKEKGIKYIRINENGIKLYFVHLLIPKYLCHLPLNVPLIIFIMNNHLSNF